MSKAKASKSKVLTIRSKTPGKPTLPVDKQSGHKAGARDAQAAKKSTAPQKRTKTPSKGKTTKVTRPKGSPSPVKHGGKMSTDKGQTKKGATLSTDASRSIKEDKIKKVSPIGAEVAEASSEELERVNAKMDEENEQEAAEEQELDEQETHDEIMDEIEDEEDELEDDEDDEDEDWE